MTDKDVGRVSCLDVRLSSNYQRKIANHILKMQNKNRGWSQVTWETCMSKSVAWTKKNLFATQAETFHFALQTNENLVAE